MKISNLITKAKNKESGAAMVLVALSMVVLLGMAAFGTDLAWFYLNASRVQRAADAGALGGVVWLPSQAGTANSTALSIAKQNGYDDTLADVVVTSGVVAGESNQLQVTVRDEVPTFFAQVFGFNTMMIQRSAVAEYIPPLKLGSPAGTFGNNCDPTQPGCGPQQNFWANIHGWFTDTAMGDAYTSHCRGSSDVPSCTPNTYARPNGYLYGIQKGTGSFTVQGLDLRFFNTSGGNPTSDTIRTGDRGCEDWTPSSAATCGPTMLVRLYAPDPTPLDLSDNGAPLCSATLTPTGQALPAAAYNWATPNGNACWTQNGSGIYVLQIAVQNPGNTVDRAGLNRYSIRANNNGAKLFAEWMITPEGQTAVAAVGRETSRKGIKTKAEKPSSNASAAAKEKKPIPWVRVYRIPTFVYFSHRVHTQAGATCATCHGPVRERDVITKEVVHDMRSCMACHAETKARNECTTCHEER
jgi:hypothetical protein